MWHNLTLCHIQKKDYKAAEEDLGKLLTISPKYTRAYLMRGEVALKQQDTIRALNDFNTATNWINMIRMHGRRGLLYSYNNPS